MPSDSLVRPSFLSRMIVPAALFVLLLSLAANVFFFATRIPVTNSFVPSSSDSSSFLPSSLGSVAFGDIVLSIPTHAVVGSGSLGVKKYVLPDGILPKISESLPLYRDQGVQIDESFLKTLFASMHAPIDPATIGMLSDTYTFKSADGALSMTLSLPTRTLTIIRPLVSGMPIPPEKADDTEVFALAKTFAATLGIDVSLLPAPIITETPATSSQPKKTFVVWPLLIDSFPVIDQDGAAVPAVKMQIGRVAHRAISVTLTLLSPDVLAHSQYPTLSSDMLTAKLRSGGLLSMPKSPEGETVTYHDAKIAYLLLPQNGVHPTYLLPVMNVAYLFHAKWFSTFVPLLDPQHFVL